MVQKAALLRRFGLSVKRARTAAKLSQERLAFAAELHPTFISQIERGIGNPSLYVIARLADALGIQVRRLV